MVRIHEVEVLFHIVVVVVGKLVLLWEQVGKQQVPEALGGLGVHKLMMG